jgi:hypothetical protein
MQQIFLASRHSHIVDASGEMPRKIAYSISPMFYLTIYQRKNLSQGKILIMVGKRVGLEVTKLQLLHGAIKSIFCLHPCALATLFSLY